MGDAKAAAAARVARVAELHEQGLTFRAIGAELGISAATAWRDCEEWHNELRRGDPDLQAAAKEALWGQLARIKTERAAVVAILTARHITVASNGTIVYEKTGEPVLDDMPALAAVDRLVKLDDQEAKLLGIYAEKKVAISGGVRYEVAGINPADLT